MITVRTEVALPPAQDEPRRLEWRDEQVAFMTMLQKWLDAGWRIAQRAATVGKKCSKCGKWITRPSGNDSRDGSDLCWCGFDD